MNDLETMLDDLVATAPVNAASWDDVLARARRARRRLVGLVALVVLAVAVATPALGVGDRLLELFDGGTPVTPDRLSQSDLGVLSAIVSGERPTQIPAKTQETLARLGVTSIRQIATRGERVYYVLETVSGKRCFALGYVGQENLFGSAACLGTSSAFPSPSEPMLDWSVFHTRPGDGASHVWRLEGFAADGVASVGVITVDGDLEAVTPVQDNVYMANRDLPIQPIREIVAFAANGDRLYSLCVAPDPDSC
jgi:hypothetical protein